MKSPFLFLYSVTGRIHCGTVLAFAVGLAIWAVLIYCLLP